MAAPFEGFAIPPTPLLVFLLVGTVTIVALLFVLDPSFDEKTVLALVPWVVTGSALHVSYLLGRQFQRQIYPSTFRPLFAAPAVYLTTFLGFGSIWVVSLMVGSRKGGTETTSRYLGAAGLGVMSVVLGLVAWQGVDPQVGPPRIVIPTTGLIASLILTFAVYRLLDAWRPGVIADAGLVGVLVLFAHILDGVTTAIGRDLLDISERSQIPRQIMDFAGDLSVAETIGAGWLFVLVKITVAVAIIWAFADYTRTDPVRANVVYAIVMIVGLGPACNNLLLFYLGV